MSRQMQVEFGKTTWEKFGYLVITSIFMFTATILFRLFILNGHIVSEEFFKAYELFYSGLGAIIGFILAQIFIRVHMRTVRRGLI